MGLAAPFDEDFALPDPISQPQLAKACGNDPAAKKGRNQGGGPPGVGGSAKGGGGVGGGGQGTRNKR